MSEEKSKKNNKTRGFTLVELLAVIFILAVIAVVIVPTINKATKKSREELYKVQINNIKKGAKNWSAENHAILPEDDGYSVTITFAQLKIGGFVDEDIRDPRTKKLFPNDMEIVVTYKQNKFIYEVIEDSGGVNDVIDRNSPSLILNGFAYEIVEIHSEYIDKGVIARDPSGAEITNIDVVIKSNNVVVPSVDTGVFKQYKITYSVNYNGSKTSAIRTLTVKDTIPPVLEIPGKIELSKSEVETFDFMAGVSVTDNSLEEINVKLGGNVSTLPGIYLVTYTAEDSSGNKSKKNRYITVRPPFPCGTDVTDNRDNNIYKTTKIGDQCWFAENLRYDCSREGYNNVGSASGWSGSNNCSNQGPEYDGLLYQWPVAMNGSYTEGSQGLCPTGWYIPTDNEWKILEGAVDSTYGVGNSVWNNLNDRGSDVATKLKEAPFNGKLSGSRNEDGLFTDIGPTGHWWTSSTTGLHVWHRILRSSKTTTYRNAYSRSIGSSVRCLLDQ